MDNHLQDISTALGITLPGAYARFLETAQLRESRLVTDLVNLYGTNDLITRNQDYQVQKYLPGYLSIGDDSGGRGILLNTTATTPTLYITGYGALDPDCLDVLSDDFLRWAAQGYSLEIIREAPAFIAARNSPAAQLRNALAQLYKALSNLEAAKSGMDLKTYLLQKRRLQQEIQHLEAAAPKND
ncbi:SMI1/KNR4 family protein [Chitinophaga qingshengii]|uniref:SMI1/KNR4 family protein n=1 Tax=Chitinophaga qingshengii TaxID=1569794 RepID=A0ABR7TQU2_9BACT|nr:SMI1/KNR4 family protein [Chitinophaga qingshengii]MBC9932355.1 SMI1/KNR4 family protein [Chitinophaga qingshengii]